jgi:hypothetical protein
MATLEMVYHDLGDFAFILCESLQSIYPGIPSSIEIVAKFCFAEYKHLSSVTFESGCRVLGVETRKTMALPLLLEPAEQGELALDWPIRCLVRKQNRPVSRSPFGQVSCRRTQTGEFPEQRSIFRVALSPVSFLDCVFGHDFAAHGEFAVLAK